MCEKFQIAYQLSKIVLSKEPKTLGCWWRINLWSMSEDMMINFVQIDLTIFYHLGGLNLWFLAFRVNAKSIFVVTVLVNFVNSFGGGGLIMNLRWMYFSFNYD